MKFEKFLRSPNLKNICKGLLLLLGQHSAKIKASFKGFFSKCAENSKYIYAGLPLKKKYYFFGVLQFTIAFKTRLLFLNLKKMIPVNFNGGSFNIKETSINTFESIPSIFSES